MEIALIKLCKPEMETNQEAILDRIRQVEDKVENGVVVTAAGAPQTADGAQVKKQKPELPKAVPDDIKQIVAKWPSIVGSAENPMRTYMKSANLSLGADGKLLVVLEDGMASDYFTQNAANKKRLEELLSDFSGKEVEVNLQAVKGRREFEESYVDLSQIIRMEIEEEEEE